jgi:hypothetical protein
MRIESMIQHQFMKMKLQAIAKLEAWAKFSWTDHSTLKGTVHSWACWQCMGASRGRVDVNVDVNKT